MNETGLHYLNGKWVTNEYYPDFDYKDGDHWMNADYYLSNSLCGDCEDFAIAISSILEAKGIPNMLVCASDNEYNVHIYLEYYYEGEYHIADSRRPYYRLREENVYKEIPEVWMFNKDYDYKRYNKNWVRAYQIS